MDQKKVKEFDWLAYVMNSLGKCFGSGFHNFQRFRGLGGQGAELDIPRRWDLRGSGGKKRPAGSHGKKVLSSGPVGFPAGAADTHPPSPRAHVTVVVFR